MSPDRPLHPGLDAAQDARLRAWLPDVELVAVCDIDPAKARSAAGRFKAGRHYTDAATMLREASDSAA